MLSSLLLAATLIQGPPVAYHIDSKAIAMLKDGDARAAGILFTADPNILLVIARDMELRWVDLRKKPDEDVVRKGMLKDQPTLVLTKEQQADVKKAEDFLIQVYGTANVPKMKGSIYPLPGNKEFCLSDRHDEFFFYSTETGELLRKVKLQGSKKPALGECQISNDQKILSVGDSERHKQMIYSADTGKLLFEVPVAFMESAKITADSKEVIHLGRSGKLTAYSIPSGKVAWTHDLPQKSVTNLVMAPVGSAAAYDILTKEGGYGGTNLIDLKSKKLTQVSQDLKEFGSLSFSPDGSLLLLWAQKWIHFVDAKTGYHTMTLRTYFTAMWDSAWTIGVSEDNSRLILVNDPNNINVDLRYSITADLKQKPGEPVKKPIKRT